MTESIINELNGRKYLLVEVLVTPSDHKKTVDKCEKYQCIYQGIKEFKKGSFFSEGYAIIKVLVPEENVLLFNEHVSK